MRIILRGSTSVVINKLEDNETPVDDPAVFQMLAERDHELQSLYDDESAFSNYVDDGTEQGHAVAETLNVGGWVRLVYDETEKKLFVETEYHTSRQLTAPELNYLVKETIGQWSDGAGANAMDHFAEHIEPYYVNLEDFRPEQVRVSQQPD